MSDTPNTKIIIEGITPDGKNFRPSDWAERLSDALSSFKRRRVIHSPLLRPMRCGDIQCLVVDIALKESHPSLYTQILSFAKNNHLHIREHTG